MHSLMPSAGPSPLLWRRCRAYYSGKHMSGLGSTHTEAGMVWALGVVSEALTAATPEEQAAALRTLLKMQCGTGLMHESVHVDDLTKCTRKWFEVGAAC